MMYYIEVHTINGKNNLQKSLAGEADRWKGTLVEDESARQACIDHFRKGLEKANEAFPKCKPCQMSLHDGSICFSTCMTDDTFAIVTFNEVKCVYDGILRMKAKEGGQQ